MSKAVKEVISQLYEDNYSHFDFMDNMGGDCDCNLHQTMGVLFGYIQKEKE